MLPDQQYETRSETIYRSVRAATASGAVDKQQFAKGAIARYHADVPVALRTIRYKRYPDDGLEASVDKHNSATFWKFWEGENRVRLPVDMEESVVLELPEPWRSYCLNDLCARYGVVPAPMPQKDGLLHQLALATYMRDTGEAATDIAEMLANQQIGPEDRHLAPKAINDLERVIADASGMIALIKKNALGLSDEPNIKAVG